MPETNQSSDTNTQLPDPPDASPEEIAAHLRETGVRAGPGTAAGLAAMGSPEGDETADDEAEGMDGWKPPNMLDQGGQNSPAQSSPALFASNGSLPHQHVASPSGPVPAGTILDPKARARAVQLTQDAADPAKRLRRAHRKLDLGVLQGMSRAEIRAVAADRGYDVPERLGRRALVNKFLDEQGADDNAVEVQEGEGELNPVSQPLPVATAGGGTPAAFPGKAQEAENKVQSALSARSEPVQQDKTASLSAATNDEKASQPQASAPARGGPAATTQRPGAPATPKPPTTPSTPPKGGPGA